MKIISFIFSTLIIILSVLPCTDGTCQRADNSRVELLIEHQAHDHSDKSQDNCTPFCTCVCCGSLITLPTLQSLLNESATISADYLSQYTFSYSFDYSEGIWHPPALS